MTQGIGSIVLALVTVISFPTADIRYLILGSCISAIAAVVLGAQAIMSLRRNEYAPRPRKSPVS